MLELGQPTHAFDADKLRGPINVRLARDDEKFLALDGKTYSLTNRNLVIADSERAVGIGGVMGGEETGVTESTRNVLLEAAYFLPASVRRTARELSLPSDASYRFERAVDPAMVLPASARAAELMREIAGGQPTSGIEVAGEVPQNVPDVSLSYEKSDQLLGITIAPKTADSILERFGLKKSESSKAESTWSIPSYRRDLQRDVDLIEEIIRAHGVSKIAGSDRSRFTPSSEADRAYDFEASVRDRLAALGIFEIRTSTLIPRDAKGGAFVESALELRNPLSEEHVMLRPSLLPGLLNVIARNIRSGAESIRLFEMGRIFQSADAAEERRLAIAFTGKAESAPHWRSDAKRKLDLFDLKGAIDAIVAASLSFQKIDDPDLALASEISLGNEPIGRIGQLAARHAANLGADESRFCRGD